MRRATTLAALTAVFTITLTAIATAAPHPGTFAGKAFDTCETPSSATMQAWSASPYRSIGIYFGGDGRGCKTQANLTAAWVGEQTARGWHLLPLYVGRQAPCSTTQSLRMAYDPVTARDQGRQDGSDALTRAAALGIGAGSALYNDMEHYDSANAQCRAAVLSYLTGWTERVHEADYLSGVYSSAASGIRDLANVYRSSTYARPDHIDFAWWNGVADTNAGSYFPSAYWSNHQRIHQYAGDFAETHGGVRIFIDANQVDIRPPVNRDFAAYPTLNRGANNPEVAALQYLLRDDGREPGAVDGDFGAGTETAVKAFQSAHGLTADGEVGRRTWTALLSAGWQPRLRPGATGQEVRRLQRALTAALGRSIGVDGQYGARTEQAVRDYQTTRGLPVDGNAGLQTWTALQGGQ
ncbi:Peptidoglycan-binding (PGRP) domain of peptidoglycan hydrolases-containing protein [Actinokineospora alba]|uniref:Peptidoglycan-binding (PGRP) domain of peptidoglycan hydrolases-containing protein n=1 Tax=Actinokineospora alba TaxID=504798 RepID=A0A1H0LQH0_9PSEU|nr:glycoside hydrolase domain-containing protein [Actinokineospora alba]TDP67415.1 peptidoglycan hydrolase-like protein with peptidoglycan-binding domain [Actinokineospora alba]SDI97333.1 Peptidoglycan-binding (PGRP) domain of peptidoglycan hydrolases-containing protein [Actinokineospora alba]SDO70472.1 Peptidoglycan-binding (PGRP) domain of peptidoglycan hydrolases-containing protein [Actinokineospora alba]